VGTVNSVQSESGGGPAVPSPHTLLRENLNGVFRSSDL